MMQLTQTMISLIELDKKEAEIKKFYEDRAELLSKLQKEIGINGMFQSPNGDVFQIQEAKGKFVTFDPLTYKRTRNTNDPKSGGSFLSKTAAKDAGFDI